MIRRQTSASQQILDFGTRATSQTSIATHTYTGDFVNATKWPLLPHQALRVWNAYGNVFADAPGLIVLQTLNLYVQLFDASGNALATSTVGLAAQNYGQAPGQGALINGTETGSQIAIAGDPLIELSSNFLLAGVSVTGAGAASFAVACAWDAYNTDTIAHNVYAAVHALISFVQR